MRFNRNIPTIAALMVASSFGITACADQQSTAVVAPRIMNVPVGLEVSSSGARVGTKIAVAVRLDVAPGTTGGIQGALQFDPTALRYVGQSPMGDAISFVGKQHLDKGQLRFTSFNAQKGVAGRVAMFVFETRSANYMASLRYEHQAAAGANGDLRRQSVNLLPTVVTSTMSVPADARDLTVTDWAARISPAAKAGTPSLNPGEYRENLKYGDIDFDGAVGLFDYLGVANAAVGNDQIIVGTDAPDVDLVIAGNVFPDNTAGACGTETDGTRILDLFDYLAIANEAVGVNEACVGDVIPGRTPLPTARQAINAGSTPGLTVGSGVTLTLTKDKVWEIGGQLRVQSGGILNIQEGTRIEGLSTATAPAIFIERGGKINAVGTQNEPIVMTCTAAVKFEGCWGGVFIAGKGIINLGDANVGGGVSPDGCAQRGGEGGGPVYGGCDNADNSGVMRYVRIEYAGYLLSPNNELNGLTLAGVGSGTQIDHIQIHAGADDGIEFFGGAVSTKYLVLTGNDDDQFDISFGNAADHQFVLIQSDIGAANNDSKAIEADGNEPAPGTNALPRTSPRLWNFTIIGNLSGTGQPAAVQLRRGSGLRLYNSVIAGWPVGVDFDDPLTCDGSFGTSLNGSAAVQIQNTTFVGVANLGNDDGSDPLCPGATSATEGEEQYIRASGNNNTETSASILTIFKDAYNTQLPDFRMLFVGGQPALGNTLAPYSGATAVATNYRGAVAPSDGGTIPWYAGWTRGFNTPTTP